MSSTPPLFAAISSMVGLPYGEKLDSILKNLHRVSPEFTRAGRNVSAGYARSWGLQFCTLIDIIKKDPIFQESCILATGWSLLSDTRLANIFLIMKYGMDGLSGDFIEFGAYRAGTAIFIANVARRLGLTGTVYALDTFEGMPPADESVDIHYAGNFCDVSFDDTLAYIKKLELTNLVLVKGLFEETFPQIAKKIKNVALAHIDCDLYSSVKYAITALQPCMRNKSGYLIFDDPIHSSCLGALEAVEEMIEEYGMRAEQSHPHLVYRLPKLEN